MISTWMKTQNRTSGGRDQRYDLSEGAMQLKRKRQGAYAGQPESAEDSQRGADAGSLQYFTGRSTAACLKKQVIQAEKQVIDREMDKMELRCDTLQLSERRRRCSQ